jgi:hypothetical protein
VAPPPRSEAGRPSTTLGGAAAESAPRKRGERRSVLSIGAAAALVALVALVGGVSLSLVGGSGPATGGPAPRAAAVAATSAPDAGGEHPAVVPAASAPDAPPAGPDGGPSSGGPEADAGVEACGQALEQRSPGGLDPTIGQGHRAQVVISSDPSQALVVAAMDGRAIGRTPFAFDHARCDGALVFIVKKRGFQSHEVRVPGDRDARSNVTLKIGIVDDREAR